MSRAANVGLVVMAGALVGCVIAIIVLAAQLNQEESEKIASESTRSESGHESVDMSSCDDIAIIGAGISGTYSAWRLRERNLKVSLYEYSNRIGGRCFTVHLPGIPDVNVEMGAMRFKPADHLLVNRTVRELGLDVVDTELAYGTNKNTLYYIRGKHMTSSELPTKAPYNIPQEYRIDLDTLKWQVFKNFTTVSENGRVLKSLDGVDLYMQSRDSYYAKYLDTETAQYLKDIGSFYREYGNVINAHYTIQASDPTGPKRHSIVKTIKQGFQAIPEALVHQFLAASNRHILYQNHHLKAIKKYERKFILSFHTTDTHEGVTTDRKGSSTIKSCAKRVILAIPRVALEHLDWDVLKQERIQDFIKHALTDIQAGKMYFGYDSAWWRKLTLTSRYIITTTPSKHIYDYAVSKVVSSAVLNTAYIEGGNKLWREILGSGEFVQGVGDKSIAATNTSVYLARKYFSEIMNVSLAEIPEPKSAVMAVWDQYPIGASWYKWAPGYHSEEVESAMIKPAKNDDVYIASNTFSSSGKTAWIQGAMEMAEKVLKHFDE